jgi:DNA relaxase NicK
MRRLVKDTNGGQTLYFGARSSERFGRIYDKGRESRSCAAGLWWRWECEFKQRVSAMLSRGLVSSADPTSYIRGLVTDFYYKRCGLRLTKISCPVIYNEPPDRSVGEKQLHWLACGVRPTLAKLIDHYGRERVLTALGLL